MPYRPANITNLPKEAAATINQLLRETNDRIDDLKKVQRPYLKGRSTLVFGTIPANSSVEATAYVSGAHTGGVALASPAQGLDVGANLTHSARVTGKNIVTVRVANPTTSSVISNTIPWNIQVII